LEFVDTLISGLVNQHNTIISQYIYSEVPLITHVPPSGSTIKMVFIMNQS